MAKMHAYLNFDGNCEEAFRFYQTVFKTENTGIHRYGDMPENPDSSIAESDKNKVMHTAIFINAETMIMGSDLVENFGGKYQNGNNTYIMLDTSAAEEAVAFHNALSEGALVMEMPLGETFFAEQYSSFQDKFGVWWMIHFEGNKKM